MTPLFEIVQEIAPYLEDDALLAVLRAASEFDHLTLEEAEALAEARNLELNPTPYIA